MFRTTTKRHLNNSESITNCESITSKQYSKLPSIYSSPLNLTKKKGYHRYCNSTTNNTLSIDEKLKTPNTSSIRTPQLMKQLSHYILFTHNSNDKDIKAKIISKDKVKSLNTKLQDIFFDKSREDKFITSQFPFKTMEKLTKKLFKDFTNYATKSNIKRSRNNYHDTLDFLNTLHQINKRKVLNRENIFMKAKLHLTEDIQQKKEIIIKRRSPTLHDLIFNEEIDKKEEISQDKVNSPIRTSYEKLHIKINKTEQLKIKDVNRKMKEIKIRNRSNINLNLNLFFNDNHLKKEVDSHNNIKAIKHPEIDNDNMNMDEYQNVKTLKVLLKDIDRRKTQIRVFDLPRFMKSQFKSQTNQKYRELSGLNFF